MPGGLGSGTGPGKTIMPILTKGGFRPQVPVPAVGTTAFTRGELICCVSQYKEQLLKVNQLIVNQRKKAIRFIGVLMCPKALMGGLL